MKRIIFVLCIALFSTVSSFADNSGRQLAFPTAEGYGKYTQGGRGGDVYEVTNLNDNGPGSLRQALEAKGARTVVFRISGTIELESPLNIKHPYITIAGQTAPGDGICIKGYPLNISADEVIIRYIRVRLGDKTGVEADAISCRYHKNIILDHVSASWSVDETMSIYHCENVTVQWCMITESLFDSGHIKGAHGFGAIWGSNYATYHHNLMAHHSSRNPRWASGGGYNDYRNNVLYNWGYNSSYGGERKQVGNDKFTAFAINFVGNYYKPGPATQPGNIMQRIASPNSRGSEDYGQWYVNGNIVEGQPEVSADNWNGGVQPSDKSLTAHLRVEHPWEAMSINEQSPMEAYKAVLKDAGCTLPKRDAVDSRIMAEAEKGEATYEGKAYKTLKRVADPTRPCGIIDTQEDVGGWPELKSLPAPEDSDHDGMPDEWEKARGLNPNNPDDRNHTDREGWTFLEVYLNGIGAE